MHPGFVSAKSSYIALTLVIGAGFAVGGGAACQTKTFSQTSSSNVLNGPLEVARDNPRYFVDSLGKPVYLTGSHTNLNLMDRGERKLDFNMYLGFLRKFNHNFTKLWMQENAGHDPLPYQRVGPGVALDGKPKFDLTQLNQAFFDRLRTRVIAARDAGIYVSIMLFQGWSVEGKTQNREVWRMHPFHKENNVNGIDGDLNGDGQGTETHMLLNPTINAIQEAYLRKIVDTVNDLDNILYEITNEDHASSENTAWQYHIINFLHMYEVTKPKQHPVGMTYQWPDGNNETLFSSPADWISPGSYDESGSEDKYRNDPPAPLGKKVVLNDTDHLWGNGGSIDWAWKSFTRGLNPIFMDVTPPLSDLYSLPQAETIRVALGNTLEYAERIDLKQMEPRRDVCSTTFCLVKPGKEYLIYAPPARTCAIATAGAHDACPMTVDLSGLDVTFTGEWFSPDTGERQLVGATSGGAVRTFNPPFGGSALLYLKDQGS